MSDRSDLDILADLGLEPARPKAEARSPREARIIAGFEDILRFAAEHGRPPRHEGDVFERLYAVRLDRLRALPEAVALLTDLDTGGLLTAAADEPIDDAALLAALGVDEQNDGLTELRHVRSPAERQAAEEVATREPCANFADYAPLFEAVRSDLAAGTRRMRRFERKAEIEQGRFFVLEGLLAYVAEAGEAYINASGNSDRRLRVIYDNGTESNLLQRSLQKALTQDDNGRRVTESRVGPLFGDDGIEGTETGAIYVLRSLSDHPYVAAHRDVIHKIGVTGGQVERRFVNAVRDPTFLMAEVEVVATFTLYDIRRSALENLLHRFFADARLEIQIDDRFGNPVQPREWFMVPFPAIKEAVEHIREGTLHNYLYRPAEATLAHVETADVSLPTR
ncbi:GIY-YIG nuclease family protein [Paracoccus luteus]|uniref:GIY-YIG nuclease family protein n=1 Tax=Paracoccus luteus TaxID=2508543 RepID=UPI0010703ABE|nr:GIY-YIG nuclease family protein [Paracoccus luteus]